MWISPSDMTEQGRLGGGAGRAAGGGGAGAGGGGVGFSPGLKYGDLPV